MKTYIINLAHSTNRKVYMEQLTKDIPELSIEFIEAVDGKKLTENERQKLFDYNSAFKRYGRIINAGEIGCTLSHQKCYHKLLHSDTEYALILEDDITFNHEINKIIKAIEPYMKSPKPLLILLSNGYYYYPWKSLPINKNYKIYSVYDAIFAHSYIINKPAAQLLIEKYPHILADDWSFFQKKGLNIKAIYPHIIDQIGTQIFISTLNEGNNKMINQNLSLKRLYDIYSKTAIKKILKLLEYYEK